MTAIFTDSTMGDDARRQRLYQGDLFAYRPLPAVKALADFARGLIEEGFGGVDPVQAQHEMPVEEFVAIFGPLKPKFIHHPETKLLLRAVMAELGADLDQTYVDVPRLRGVTSDGYLTAGVGYAFPLHRDVWWSAPLAQINWWLPIYDMEIGKRDGVSPQLLDQGHQQWFGTFQLLRL